MSFVLAIVAAVIAIIVSVIGALVVRRTVPGDVLRGHHDVAAAILGVMGTLYAVLLAFTVVIVWNHYTDAESATDAEADHMANLSRLTRALPPDQERRVRARLMEYGNVVVRDEWPAMANGTSAPTAWAALSALWSECRSINPVTPREQTIYSESMKQLQAISDSRRGRLQSLKDDVPGLMWIILIGGGAMVVAFTYLFGPQRVALHALMVGALATLIVMSLFLVQSLDNPFDGWPTVDPGIIQEQLDRIASGSV